MDVITIVLIAVGLAMDAFAVSIANGMTAAGQKRKNALVMAAFFSVFQMLMPVVGWLAGVALADLIMEVDHWVAFGLLAAIGAKMIYEATQNESGKQNGRLRLHTLLTLSVATSIDALMVGLSFAFLQTALTVPIIAIGVVTFVLSFAGYLCGGALGRIFKGKIKAVGGVILILIGVKILFEHLLQ